MAYFNQKLKNEMILVAFGDSITFSRRQKPEDKWVNIVQK